MRLIPLLWLRTLWRTGPLNIVLLMIMLAGILSAMTTIAYIQGMHAPTFSEIAESRKKATPFETLTEKQLQEGTMVEGSIFFNMGEFANSKNDNGDSYGHYAILLDDKVMSIAAYGPTESRVFRMQANDYRVPLLQNGLNFLGYNAKNSNSKNKKKKSQENRRAVEQIIQETMEHESGIAFRGKVVKIDPRIENNLRDFVTPDREKEPAFEIIPYEIKIGRDADPIGEMRTYILMVLSAVLEDIIAILAFRKLFLRLRKCKIVIKP